MAMDADQAGGNGPRKTVSLWDIERLLLGELRGEEAEAVRRAVDASPELRGYLERMEHEAPRRTLEDLRRLHADRRAAGAGVEDSRAGKPAGGRSASRSPGTFPWPGPGVWRPALAFCAMLLAAAVVWRFQDGGPRPGDGAAYQSKGGKGRDSLEVRLSLGGRTIQPGDTATARNGDTLAFLYRAPHPVDVRLFYQEDGADPMPADVGTALRTWPAATRWTPAPRRMLLEGNWRRQAIWIVAGDTARAAEAVAAAAAAASKGGPADPRIRVFHLKAAGPEGAGP